MQINFEQLRNIMKSSGIPVYRDEAPSTVRYPYIIYEFVNEQQVRASNSVLRSLPLYQIALITDGIETDIQPLKDVFASNGVICRDFTSLPYDENDSTITQFITYVRCVDGQ